MLGATAERPRRRKPDAYLGQISVAADGPVTLRLLTGGVPDAFSVTTDANGRSALVCVTRWRWHLQRGDANGRFSSVCVCADKKRPPAGRRKTSAVSVLTLTWTKYAPGMRLCGRVLCPVGLHAALSLLL